MNKKKVNQYSGFLLKPVSHMRHYDTISLNSPIS